MTGTGIKASAATWTTVHGFEEEAVCEGTAGGTLRKFIWSWVVCCVEIRNLFHLREKRGQSRKLRL